MRQKKARPKKAAKKTKRTRPSEAKRKRPAPRRKTKVPPAPAKRKVSKEGEETQAAPPTVAQSQQSSDNAAPTPALQLQHLLETGTAQAHDILVAARPDGFCLWVGAGASIQLAAGKTKPLLWSQFVDVCEKRWSLPKPPPGASFPERLEVVQRNRGRYGFQCALRDAFLTSTATSVVEACREHGNVVPDQVAALARLGNYANPIVNFNVEHLSSMMLGLPAGPIALRVFEPPVPGTVDGVFGFGDRMDAVHPEATFRRVVYHPHGALHAGGICVMTREEYGALDGTLALQLAVHLAFGRHLLIVGMSLDDTYLREQLGRFRTQLRQVVWFVGEPVHRIRPELRRWAWSNHVTVVQVEWPVFWLGASMRLHTFDDELRIKLVWHNTVREAFNMLSNPKLANLNLLLSHNAPLTLDQISRSYVQAFNSGEDMHYAPDPNIGLQMDSVLQPLQSDLLAAAREGRRIASDPNGYLSLLEP